MPKKPPEFDMLEFQAKDVVSAAFLESKEGKKQVQDTKRLLKKQKAELKRAVTMRPKKGKKKKG